MAESVPIRVARGIRIDAERQHDLTAVCAAVLETSASYTVLSLLTAARLHRLWLPPDADMRLHVATARPGVAGRNMTRTRRREFVAHRLQLVDDEIAYVDGLPVSSLARTFADLAGLLALPDLVALGDSALRAGTSVEELSAAVHRMNGGRGVRRARAALPLLDARSRSRPETHLRVAATAVGLPPFEVNEAIYRSNGGWLAEPDLSNESIKLALEYQGADHADVERMRRDITRSADMRDDGWMVIDYGPKQVFGRPWQIAPQLRVVVAERRRLPGG